jgi:ABC-2 type transport system ATP-binding protein
MAIVELDRIRKVYDTKVAVEGLTLRIEPGTMFGLLGPNGSGKSSSIRMMIGITQPDSGAVRLFDKPFAREALHRIGYLPEERGLYKKMKVLDQLVFLGQLHGLDPVSASRRAHVWCRQRDAADGYARRPAQRGPGDPFQHPPYGPGGKTLR